MRAWSLPSGHLNFGIVSRYQSLVGDHIFSSHVTKRALKSPPAINVSSAQYPFYAEITVTHLDMENSGTYGKYFTCGSTLVHRAYLVTAAHCVVIRNNDDELGMLHEHI